MTTSLRMPQSHRLALALAGLLAACLAGPGAPAAQGYGASITPEVLASWASPDFSLGASLVSPDRPVFYVSDDPGGWLPEGRDDRVLDPGVPLHFNVLAGNEWISAVSASPFGSVAAGDRIRVVGGGPNSGEHTVVWATPDAIGLPPGSLPWVGQILWANVIRLGHPGTAAEPFETFVQAARACREACGCQVVYDDGDTWEAEDVDECDAEPSCHWDGLAPEAGFQVDLQHCELDPGGDEVAVHVRPFAAGGEAIVSCDADAHPGDDPEKQDFVASDRGDQTIFGTTGAMWQCGSQAGHGWHAPYWMVVEGVRTVGCYDGGGAERVGDFAPGVARGEAFDVFRANYCRLMLQDVYAESGGWLDQGVVAHPGRRGYRPGTWVLAFDSEFVAMPSSGGAGAAVNIAGDGPEPSPVVALFGSRAETRADGLGTGKPCAVATSVAGHFWSVDSQIVSTGEEQPQLLCASGGTARGTADFVTLRSELELPGAGEGWIFRRTPTDVSGTVRFFYGSTLFHNAHLLDHDRNHGADDAFEMVGRCNDFVTEPGATDATLLHGTPASFGDYVRMDVRSSTLWSQDNGWLFFANDFDVSLSDFLRDADVPRAWGDCPDGGDCFLADPASQVRDDVASAPEAGPACSEPFASGSDGMPEMPFHVPAWRDGMQYTGLLFSDDADGDGVPDAWDVCREVADPEQVDGDGDAIGNRCDCDFDQDGTCSLADFWLLVGDLVAGTPTPPMATDMSGDGVVNLEDWLLFVPGILAGEPGPAAP